VKNGAHVVQIPVTGDGAEPAGGAFLGKAVSGHHPLGEIADSGGHLLLPKLWQWEESRHNRRASALEVLMDAARRDVFYLYAALLALYGLFLALLFAAISIRSFGIDILTTICPVGLIHPPETNFHIWKR
jgi:hypothetical protein